MFVVEPIVDYCVWGKEFCPRFAVLCGNHPTAGSGSA